MVYASQEKNPLALFENEFQIPKANLSFALENPGQYMLVSHANHSTMEAQSPQLTLKVKYFQFFKLFFLTKCDK